MSAFCIIHQSGPFKKPIKSPNSYGTVVVRKLAKPGHTAPSWQGESNFDQISKIYFRLHLADVPASSHNVHGGVGLLDREVRISRKTGLSSAQDAAGFAVQGGFYPGLRYTLLKVIISGNFSIIMDPTLAR